ncbi:hypothetical protein C4D60_Mb05t25390 [Musa balbisiana]|uniref:Uncharacterized protein n=1 Tax=Musa balbisiana TaxID=52838 RepID=A0A4S8JYS7_MUSBA|nr:hypothetical protein C4D60_Mb05t25390 [Musa balbisiana]
MKDITVELLQKQINEKHECFHNDKPSVVCFLFIASLPVGSTAKCEESGEKFTVSNIIIDGDLQWSSV